ncbi:ATP-binding cassette domain-containing protein [Kribbella speibonae]|uniref:ABC transporter ATP-binding protein n=1 Tax=Kribbella speibonae TaxID=1572660 RepID=A0A4R0IE40_9ACTN|nr:ATP-binding cassette domain-containing protein [Kribbella speibonae]TCC22909.1 ABC transporter ATP-binding protein [Kribbella speibonae]TCC30224.1 ABC transporter ATP-binding protein [Kribbella speibonae]
MLEARNIVVEYAGRGWRSKGFRALQDVSFDIKPHETLGLVGESGSGKTTIGRAILGLVPVSSGSIRFDGQELAGMARRERRRLSDDIQVVFQDPYSSLNPSMTVEDILVEPLVARRTGDRREATERVRTLLDQVGLPQDAVHRLPREFSGGQRQRIAIARALALRPKLIVCDEPVSALDLSTQARVLDLFISIQEETGVAYLFISHDLAVVRHISHRVAVLYRGDIVEYGDALDVTERPEHPYTKRLLMAAPLPDPDRQAARRQERRELLASEAMA